MANKARNIEVVLRPPVKARSGKLESDVAPRARHETIIPKAPAMPRRIRRKREEILKSFVSPLEEAEYIVRRLNSLDLQKKTLLEECSEKAFDLVKDHIESPLKEASKKATELLKK